MKYKKDILNSEGTILGFYKLQDRLILGSYLTDGTGTIYYSTTKEGLLKYLKSDINLRELYLDGDEFIVSRNLRNDTESYLKQDFENLLQCGKEYYNKLYKGLKNPNIEDLINGS